MPTRHKHLTIIVMCRASIAQGRHSQDTSSQLSPSHTPAGAIGSFDGLGHLVRVCDTTKHVPLRHQLLALLEALLHPRCLAASPQVQNQDSIFNPDPRCLRMCMQILEGPCRGGTPGGNSPASPRSAIGCFSSGRPIRSMTDLPLTNPSTRWTTET